ncbi:MAG: FG-GAP-like repeat-containing protein [Actinomycetota bacterium]|nr:FG-GAP-like repeat-containing protein [Actinomycetota bacterium]
MQGLKTLVRIATLVGFAAAALIFPIGAAHADVVMNASMSWPSGAGVGATSLPASFTVQNANTSPQQNDTLTITVMRLAPSCAVIRSGANVCPSPDPGVYTLTGQAIGKSGTGCAGNLFNRSSPDASGVVTLTPTVGSVVLQPPGGTTGSDRCTVELFVDVTKVPSTDVDPGAPGIQTSTNLYIQATSSPSGLNPAVGVSLETTVNPGIPGLSTAASVVPPGTAVKDTATLTRAGNGPTPTGSVTFQLYGPNDNSCAGTPQTSTQIVMNGTATSPNFATPMPGVYRFTATYNGDANYMSRFALCNDPGETVTAGQSGAFPGVSVFRPSNGGWYFNNPPAAATYGASGDLAVPGDYDGDGKVDMAVYRPSVGTWYIHNSSTNTDTVRNYGVSSDIPVPAAYDGTGKTDIAVYRPSTGTWYIHNTNGPDTIITFGGIAGDIPVPGDWEGTGKADLAIYRPSSGTWFIRQSSGTVTAVNYGGNTGDIPVPGDYDGDGKTDMAIYRPSVGTWYIHNSGAGTDRLLNYGVSTDQPVPGDYKHNGTANIAVFRPSTAAWYIRNTDGTDTIVTFGIASDQPLPLPYAIRHLFF